MQTYLREDGRIPPERAPGPGARRRARRAHPPERHRGARHLHGPQAARQDDGARGEPGLPRPAAQLRAGGLLRAGAGLDLPELQLPGHGRGPELLSLQGGPLV